MSKDFQAVDLFNQIKEQYQNQIRVLTTLKQEVTRTSKLDQGQKSALRIQIESILIDINEEIFAISEELATAFQMTKSEQNSRELLHRAQEFEQKKVRLMQKVRQSIDNNPSTQVVKSELGDMVSPQKESTVMSIIRKYSNSNERISNTSPLRNVGSFSVNMKNKESVETFGNSVISPDIQRKKSPTPLRNRANIETPDYQRRSKSRNSRNSKTSKINDNRSSRKSISRQSLNTKMALNQIYSLKKTNKQKRNIPKLMPKFSGCGPGGTNSSLMVLHREPSEVTLTMDQRKSNPMQIQLKKQNSQQDLNRRFILHQNDKSLKKARQETFKNQTRPQTSLSKKRSTSILSNLEERHNQSMQATFEKSFSKKGESEPKQFDILQTKEKIHQSEAVLQFSKDFDLMRKKFGEMHSSMSEYQSNINGLMRQVKELKDENLKLNTDIRVIRNEHSEMAHTVYKLEQKNISLVKENEGLKHQLGRLEIPRPPTDLPRQRSFQQVIESPFNNVLNKRQNHERTGAFPTINNSVKEISHEPQSPQKIITFQSPESEANDEELSDWVLQRLQGLKAQ